MENFTTTANGFGIIFIFIVDVQKPFAKTKQLTF